MDISSKFSIYDILAMIIPGCIIIAFISICIHFHLDNEETIIIFNNPVKIVCIKYIKDLSALQLFTLFIIAYFIGLINNWMNDGIFRGFRNNPEAIENSLNQVLYENNITYTFNYRGYIYTYQTRERKNLWKITKVIIRRFPKQSPANFIMQNYYHIYYKLAKQRLLGNIPQIESQVALLRNTIVPLSILIVMLIINNSHLNFIIYILLLLSDILLFFVMIQRQNKIYNMIWESGYYYS